jgi:hypothetical protein
MENSTENKELGIESNGRGGQPGNQNAKKNKMFYDRIQKHLIQNPHKLEKIVETLVQEAQNGEPWAVKEIMDRMDGKAVQATEISGADGGLLETLNTINIVLKKPNGV